MKKKNALIAGVIAVVIMAIGIAAVVSTQRAEYEANDLIISGNSNCQQCIEGANLMREAAEGTNVKIIFVDPATEPKKIPQIKEADINMENEGAMLFYSSDGEHTHEVVVQQSGHVESAEAAQKLIQVALSGGQDATSSNITFAYAGDGCANCLAVQKVFTSLGETYASKGLTFTYYDMNTQKDEAAKTGLTEVHSTVLYDSSGASKVYPGEIGTTETDITNNLNKMTLE